MKDFIAYLAKALVDSPEQVTVNEVRGEQAAAVELSVAKKDLGKIIGKQGRTAHAIRTIVNAASKKKGRRYVVEFIE